MSLDIGTTRSRIDHLGLDAEARTATREAWTLVEPHLRSILDAFYDRLTAQPELADKLQAQSLDRLKAAQTEHWRALFTGQFDEDYVARVQRIGRAHHRIGLEPRWYIAAYSFFLDRIGAIVAQTLRRDAVRCERLMAAVRAAVFLDMDLAFDVYFDAALHQAHDLVCDLAESFRDTVLGSIGTVDGVASRVASATANLRGEVEATAGESTEVATRADESSRRVQVVASAAEQLAGSIGSVAAQVRTVSGAVTDARAAADATRDAVAGLNETVERIGGALRLIGTIASQTNLLALNATIEAARAGDAGKGFAVVATEVKQLARQTANATEEIAELLSRIRGEAARMSGGIGRIDESVAGLEASSGRALDAIREQETATADISSNIAAGARAVEDISRRIGGVSGSLRTARTGVDDAARAGRELTEASGALGAALRRFLDHLLSLRMAA
ncbi:globin-coupled sensor protein [Azospirillum sp. TSO22-1]|uniref:globin-coupled sensor protein n=1 Tax=Azospirillum sp. TSO22-1 TaxID=716789 RepID=UPI000D65C386|nr:globin-coupled sensor protein [Azospirillum sp. TSO22-1]